MSKGNLLSIVAPVFNEAEVVASFYARTKKVVDALESMSHEFIFVDDGSDDGTFDELTRIAATDPHVRIVRFSRNFGHQVAITAGLDYSAGDAVVIIDADLQDPPEVISEFLEKWREGYDVVYGVREKRSGETRLKLMTASLFYRLMRSLTKIDIPVDVGDFRLLSRRVVEKLRLLPERDRFVRGLVSWVGFNQVGFLYRRDPRFAGETKYPYRRMIKFALDGVTAFSSVPLQLATWLGYFSSFLAFIYLCSVFVQKLLGYTVQGWATIMVALLFLGGVQLICLGIMGEYIGRIFNETKKRPLYLVDQVHSGGMTVESGLETPVEDRAVSQAVGR